jgi:acetoin utilization deacetylase AcuC-like enzyme
MVQDWSRRLRRLWHRFRTPNVPIVYHPSYSNHVAGVPLDPLRGEKILAALEEAGLLRPGDVSRPRPASLENILRLHTPEYLERLQDVETLSRILGIEIPAHSAETTLDLQRLMVGGTIQATRLALRTGGTTIHLGGGFHHALRDSGQGFCVFNDVAVAISRLRSRGYLERILVVDLDLHDGNGTRGIYAADPTVHTLSIHHADWGPTEAVESTAIALGPGVEDARYLSVVADTLPRVFDAFRPALVYYLAGTDPAVEDPLSNWRLTAEGLRRRDDLVAALTREIPRPIPMVVLLAGGYGPVAWRHSARFLLRLASGRDLEPLGDEDLSLWRARRLSRAGAVPGSPSDSYAFSLTGEDLIGLSPGLPPPLRFLGALSRHGAELLLERLGILAQLRSKGFRDLRIDLVPGAGLGDTLRIVCGDRAPEEVLIELRVGRSHGVIPDMEVVAVEWLLLQNPRASFSADHPRLPGQQYPGLGLLKDVLAWLVALCESQGLDGVHFVAAHYHVAMQGRRTVRFLHPEDEARTRALAAALAGLSLAQAALALDSGRVRQADGDAPVSWVAAPMVLPVSRGLEGLVSGPEYEASVAEASGGFRYYLPAGVEARPARQN